MRFRLLPVMFLAGGCLFPCPAQVVTAPPPHDFLHAQYDRLHASPEQEKFRRISPMPAGVVYIQRPGEGEAEIRAHFRTMKSLGFNALKEILPVAGWTIEKIQLLALEEGLIPWWYGEGGWKPITPDLLKRLDIPARLPMAEIRNHPRMQAYQRAALQARITRTIDYAKTSPTGLAIQGRSTAFDPTIGGRGLDLSDKGRELFVVWARQQYGTIDALNDAYNTGHADLQPKGGTAFASWDDFARRWSTYNPREYRIVRDIMRFKAEHGLARIRETMAAYRAFDPDAPFRGGGELGLFLPQSWYGVDLEGIADLMRTAGSFYPSIHFSWHFGQVNNELTRPFYMQAAFAHDLFKGGWSGAWECSGGPQQFDGESGAPDRGFYVDEGVLTQFFLSQLAAGFKGFGVWSWSARTAGKEAGEYSLLDRNNGVTPRAVRVGKIGQGMQQYRDELWQAHKEPLVGILYSWDNEGIWSAMSIRGREAFRMRPVEARIGASRAFLNANVPFEYVTADDLRNGLGPRYPVLYLPAVLALHADLWPLLKAYVAAGGRLVMDMPSAWYDAEAKLLPTGRGSPFEEIFGVTLDDFQFSGVNRVLEVEGTPFTGSFAHLTPTRAQVLATFTGGKPAVTAARLGKGTAVLIGYAASAACTRPGNPSAEGKLVRDALGPLSSPYACEGALVYRLAAPGADHYFFINDGPATEAVFRTPHQRYKTATDVLTGEKVSLAAAIPLAGYDGRWLRCEK